MILFLLYFVFGLFLDGYVCLLEGVLVVFVFDYVVSGFDLLLLVELCDNVIDVCFVGYIEWYCMVGVGVVYVMVGWDWYFECVMGMFVIVGGDVCSNVMVIDVKGVDIGMLCMVVVFVVWFVVFDWFVVVVLVLFGYNDVYYVGLMFQ